MSVTIDLRQPHLFIHKLTCPELPDFAVLIGRNGAGKTQLLRAVMEGNAVVPGTQQHEMELYDMLSFRPANNVAGNRNSSAFARNTVGDYLNGDQGPPPIAVAAEIFERFTAEIEREGGESRRAEFVNSLRERTSRTPDFHVFPTGRTRGSTSYEGSLYDRVWAPLMKRGSNPARRAGQRFASRPPPRASLRRP